MAHARERLMLFRAAGDTKIQGPIPNGASLTMVFLGKDNKTEKGFVVRNNDSMVYGYLMVKNVLYW